jgi:sugar O-acyltransferase (sialic acid O-acetyltransferase NeuD family)
MTKLQKLIVIGAGGLGSEVVWAAENLNARTPTFEILGFCDDDAGRKGSTFYHYPVLGNPEEITAQLGETPGFLCAVGNNHHRAEVVQRVLALGWKPLSVIEPSVMLARDVTIGPGTYVAAGSTLSPDANVGSHVILNLKCTIAHHSHVEDFAQVSPTACVSGYCVVKKGAMLGSNAVVGPRIVIGAWSTLGASSFAVEDVPDGATAMGNPARVMFRSSKTV